MVAVRCRNLGEEPSDVRPSGYALYAARSPSNHQPSSIGVLGEEGMQPEVTATLFWTATLAALALVVLYDRNLRTARTVAFLAIILLAVWLVGATRMQYGVILEGCLWTAAFIGSLVANGSLRAMKQPDHRFASAFKGLLGDMRILRGRADQLSSAEYTQAFSDMVDRFRAAQAPSDDWRAFQADVVAHFGRRLEAILTDDLSPSTRDLVDREWERLKEQYESMYWSKSSFWRGFRRRVPRPS
jgi:hypothetical protein